MNKENFPNIPDKKEEEDYKLTASIALSGIEEAWRKINDTEGLPLSSDPLFESVADEIEKNSSKFGKALLESAKESTGEDRIRYARGLIKLLNILSGVEIKKVIADLNTSKEEIEKLVKGI